MAAFVLNSLAGKAAAVEPLHIKSRDKLYATLHNHLLMKERDVYKGRYVTSRGPWPHHGLGASLLTRAPPPPLVFSL